MVEMSLSDVPILGQALLDDYAVLFQLLDYEMWLV